jgi:asparagine synthase (glutamine-hydrolysing)
MCGIAGIVIKHDEIGGSRAVVERMVSLIGHRGPDDRGIYEDDDAILGHARLSIIDLAGGVQPIHNEDKSLWVVFNGEIFNYIELRKQLQNGGHVFYTDSDTEVIVHLYEQYGDDFVNYLNGQFAIALWDKRKQRLLLLRDRAGILPLFFALDNQRLIFGSEIKSVLCGIGRKPAMNIAALDQIFTFWSPVSPNTLFEGVQELSPGHIAIYEHGCLTLRSYWNWEFPENGGYTRTCEHELADELHALLIDATNIRLRADVPVGAYLSGGLDSSILTSLVHHYGGVPLRTFSIGFEDESLDESGYQQELIDHLEAEHTRILCKHKDIATNLEKTIWHTESTILRTAPVPMGQLSGLVHEQNYKVVLTGEGADEVFGGYDIFKEAKIRQFWARYPQSEFRPLLLKKLYPYLDLSGGRGKAYVQAFFGAGLEKSDASCFSHIPRWTTTSKIKMFYSDESRDRLKTDAVDTIRASFPEQIHQWHSFCRAQYIEAKSLMGGYLLSSQGDRMLMMNSVEGRFPYLDHRVIEFANRLPPKLKMKVLNEKYLLKQAMAKYLPKSVLERYKQPYRAPDIPSFFTDSTPEYVEEALSEDALNRSGYFDSKKVSMLLKKIKRGKAVSVRDNMVFTGVLSTQVWHRLFIEDFESNIINHT